MNIKRFLIKFIKGFAISVLTLTIFFIAMFAYYERNKTDEATIAQEYRNEKQKYDMLEMIADDFVLVGQGINTMELPHDIIYYKLYNTEDNNIIFYYYLKENDDYSAKITLSYDYDIIEEVYNTKLDDYEEYKKTIRLADYLNAILFSMIVASLIMIVFWAIYSLIIYLYHHYQKKKTQKDSNNESNETKKEG